MKSSGWAILRARTTLHAGVKIDNSDLVPVQGEYMMRAYLYAFAAINAFPGIHLQGSHIS
jgi:hypothetical protein